MSSLPERLPVSRAVRNWRKLAGAAWGAPSDPQFYGDLEVDATALLAYLEEVRTRTGDRVTVTDLVGRAVARALAEVADVAIPFRRSDPGRQGIGIFFIVDGDDHTLTGVKIDDTDRKSAVEVSRETRARYDEIAHGNDPTFERSKVLFARLPRLLLGPAMRAGAWLACDMDLDLPWLGVARRPFGDAMITSIGMWGVSKAYSPLADYYRVPLLVLVGAVQERAVVESGEVVVRPMLGMTGTFDHRYIDGYRAACLAREVMAYCTDPAAFEPPLPERARRRREKATSAVSAAAGPLEDAG